MRYLYLSDGGVELQGPLRQKAFVQGAPDA
jgi:hypothetical protein